MSSLQTLALSLWGVKLGLREHDQTNSFGKLLPVSEGGEASRGGEASPPFDHDLMLLRRSVSSLQMIMAHEIGGSLGFFFLRLSLSFWAFGVSLV